MQTKDEKTVEKIEFNTDKTRLSFTLSGSPDEAQRKAAVKDINDFLESKGVLSPELDSRGKGPVTSRTTSRDDDPTISQTIVSARIAPGKLTPEILKELEEKFNVHPSEKIAALDGTTKSPEMREAIAKMTQGLKDGTSIPLGNLNTVSNERTV